MSGLRSYISYEAVRRRVSIGDEKNSVCYNSRRSPRAEAVRCDMSRGHFFVHSIDSHIPIVSSGFVTKVADSKGDMVPETPRNTAITSDSRSLEDDRYFGITTY